MRILFALDSPAWPDSVNGAVITVHEYALELVALGHSVAVLGRLVTGGWRNLRLRLLAKASGQGLAMDTRAGYPVYRSWLVNKAVARVCAAFQPDVAVVFAGEMTPLARALEQAGPRIWLYHHAKSRFNDTGFNPSPTWGQMACSAFLADSYAARHGARPAVVPPFVRREKYEVPKTGNSVLFVNPIPDKGVDVALALAEYRPDVHFVFLESWSLSSDSLTRTRERTRRLRNVSWRPPTHDMRTAFSSARLVLIPSRVEEAWGRLPAEAACSGIPVLASAIGGLVESVGSAGRLVLPDAPMEDWFRAFGGLWDDPQAYERHALAARAMAQRQDSTPRRCALRMVAQLEGPPGLARAPAA